MMKRRLVARGLVLLVPLLVGTGAIVAFSRASVRSSERLISTGSDQVHGAPKGRWRLAPPQDLDRVVLFVSHILIRHREVQTVVAPFNPGDWSRLGPPPDRTREQARELAAGIATRAKRDRFDDLARRHSEDEVSRQYGGSLGGVIATDLSPWPHVLDALAATPAGETTAVVETEFGFHVFHRDLLPPAQRVAGRRIAIGYSGSAWLGFAGRPGRQARTRTREQAVSLAAAVAARARRSPGEFSRLVEEFSDHRDAAQGGDLGAWSTHEPTYIPREVQVLSRLRPGEIAEPVDSRCGIEILQRTDAAERPRFAMNAIRIPFDPGQPATRAAAKDTARKMIAELARDPGKLTELQRRTHSDEVEAWALGRGPFGLTDWLARLPIGAISLSPAESDQTMVVARRIDPSTVPAMTASTFELPSPAAPDLEYFVRTRRAEAVVSFLSAAAEELRVTRKLSPRETTAVGEIHAALKATMSQQQDPGARLADYRNAMARIQSTLGRDGLQAYAAIASTRLERMLLGETH